MSEALRPVVSAWTKLLSMAHDHKKREFQDDADLCYSFLDGPYDNIFTANFKSGGSKGFAFLGDGEEIPPPSARMTVNKAAELIQLFGPALYHRNPVRKVNPREVVQPPAQLYGDMNADPMAAMLFEQDMTASANATVMDTVRAEVMERYLNFTPTALDLKTHAMDGINEALLKGAGVWWPDEWMPPGGQFRYAGSFYDTIDNLYLDPDATDIRNVKWCARKCVKPVWEVARQYQIPEEKLEGRGSMHSNVQTAAADTDVDSDWRRRQGRSADLLVYWEIWSKMGMGGRLLGMDKAKRNVFDAVGDYAYLAVAEGVDYPLNLPPPYCDVFDVEKLPAMPPEAVQGAVERLRWKTPFWADNAWPFEMLAFHRRPGKLWPMSHLKPALGELLFINWVFCMLATKVKVASRDFIAIAKSASDELKEKIRHGADYTVIEVEAIHGSIDQVVQFLQHPTFHPEIVTVLEMAMANFDKRTGMTELVYGMSSRQYRSAQEANIKADAMNVRPDEMANKVEDVMTNLARKEAFVARWHLQGSDVAPALGQTGAQLWDKTVVPTDPSVVLNNLEYRIEASSARKPNKAVEAENMQTAMQNLFQALLQYAQATGDVTPLNSLVADWAESIDLDPERYLFNPPPPPPTAPPGEAPGQAAPPGRGGVATNGQAVAA